MECKEHLRHLLFLIRKKMAAEPHLRDCSIWFWVCSIS